MSCNNPLQEFLEAYAVGALEGEEHARVEQHLLECAECRQQVEAYRAAANTLTQALAEASKLPLPPTLKARVLQAVETERGRAQSPSAAPGPWYEMWQGRVRAAVTFGLAVLLAVSLAWGVQLNVALAKERTLREEYAHLVDRTEIVFEVLDSDKATKAFLRAAQSGSTSYGKLWTRPDMPYVVVQGGRLPPAPPGQAFHLWVTSRGETRLGGILKVNDQGYGLLVFTAEQNGPVYDQAQVTLQPLGDPAPGGSLILTWEAKH